VNFLNLNLQEKLLYIVITIYLLFLAHSEALKNIAIYLMLVYFLLQLLIGRVALTKDIINISIIAHFFIVIIGIWIGINPKESLGQFMDVAHIVLIFLFFRELNLKFLTYERILQFLLLGFAFASILGLYTLFIAGGHVGGLPRLELHSVGSVNRSSVYMMYIFVTALCFINPYKSKLSKYLFPFILFLSVISILIASSRMAIFSLPFVIILYYILNKKISLKNMLLLFLTSFTLIFSAINFLDGSSVFNIDNPSFIEFLMGKISGGLNVPIRLQIWTSSLYAWAENNLWFGVGVGNSIFIDVRTYFGAAASTAYIDNPHNVYLDMLLERGIFGIVTFISFMFSIFLIQNDHKLVSPIFLKILVFSLLLMGLVNITFRYEFALLFVTLIGAYLNPSIQK